MNESVIYNSSITELLNSNIRLMRERIYINKEDLIDYDVSKSVKGNLISSNQDGNKAECIYLLEYDPSFDEYCDLIVFINQSDVNVGYLRLLDNIVPNTTLKFYIKINFNIKEEEKDVVVINSIDVKTDTYNKESDFYSNDCFSVYSSRYSLDGFDISSDFRNKGLSVDSNVLRIDGLKLNIADILARYSNGFTRSIESIHISNGVYQILLKDSSNRYYLNGVNIFNIVSNGIQFIFNSSSITYESGEKYIDSDGFYILTNKRLIAMNLAQNKVFTKSINYSEYYYSIDFSSGLKLFRKSDFKCMNEKYQSDIFRMHYSINSNSELILNSFLGTVITQNKSGKLFIYFKGKSTPVNTNLSKTLGSKVRSSFLNDEVVLIDNKVFTPDGRMSDKLVEIKLMRNFNESNPSYYLSLFGFLINPSNSKIL